MGDMATISRPHGAGVAPVVPGGLDRRRSVDYGSIDAALRAEALGADPGTVLGAGATVPHLSLLR
jgi:hypothetical protein